MSLIGGRRLSSYRGGQSDALQKWQALYRKMRRKHPRMKRKSILKLIKRQYYGGGPDDEDNVLPEVQEQVGDLVQLLENQAVELGDEKLADQLNDTVVKLEEPGVIQSMEDAKEIISKVEDKVAGTELAEVLAEDLNSSELANELENVPYVEELPEEPMDNVLMVPEVGVRYPVSNLDDYTHPAGYDRKMLPKKRGDSTLYWHLVRKPKVSKPRVSKPKPRVSKPKPRVSKPKPSKVSKPKSELSAVKKELDMLKKRMGNFCNPKPRAKPKSKAPKAIMGRPLKKGNIHGKKSGSGMNMRVGTYLPPMFY